MKTGSRSLRRVNLDSLRDNVVLHLQHHIVRWD